MEISQRERVCSSDKLHLAWIENLGLDQLEIMHTKTALLWIEGKLLAGLQDLSLCAAGNNSKKLE